MAATYLQAQGLQVMDRRFRQAWGEIDLICRERSTWVFVEVKTRLRSGAVMPAVEAVHKKKQERLARTALGYMKWKRLHGHPMRFDLVLIEGGAIEWIQNAFDLPGRYTA